MVYPDLLLHGPYFAYRFLLKKCKFKHYASIVLLFIISLIAAFLTHSLFDYIRFISKFIQNYTIIYVIIFIEGMFFARYPLIDHISSKLNALASLILLLLTFIARTLLIRAPSDCLFDLIMIVPFIINFTKLITYSKTITNILTYLGKYSSYMWYTHAYFYSNLFFNLVLRFDLSLLVYLQVVIYSLLSSIVFDFIEQKLNSLFMN